MLDLANYRATHSFMTALEYKRQNEGWNYLEADYLVLPQSQGLLATEGGIDSRPGLHIIIGRNNASKTRLLKAIENSRLGRTLDVENTQTLPQQIQQKLISAKQLLSQKSIKYIHANWKRIFSTAKLIPGTESHLQTEFLQAPWPEAARSFNGHQTYSDPLQSVKLEIDALISKLIHPRPAVMVPTNRFIRDAGALNATANTNIDNLDLFVPILENLKREYETEYIYTNTSEAFKEITDGLTLEFRGSNGNSILNVRETGMPPRQLNQCGDGLRDLVVILAFAATYSDCDLIIDEPGLRLHPHAQRKLLRHLEHMTLGRSLWIASHDGAFVGSPSAQRRYAVQRDSEKGISHVRELPTQSELREFIYELGWTPQDALLADRVLYCEGPADKIVFEGIVRRLSEEEATFGGTIVAELGGDGAVWGGNPQVLRSIEFLQRVAPHADHVILLDKGKESDESVERLTKWLEERGARVRFLKRNELENYFLESALVEELCKRATTWPGPWYRGDPSELKLLSAEEISSLLQGKDLVSDKGSAILKDIFQRIFSKEYDKTRGAQSTMAVWEKLAPQLSKELIDEVKSALLST